MGWFSKSEKDKLNDELFSLDIGRIEKALKAGADANVDRMIKEETGQYSASLFSEGKVRVKRNFTPLTYTLCRLKNNPSFADILRIMVKNGVDLNKGDKDGRLPLNAEIDQRMSVENVKLMLDLGAGLGGKDFFMNSDSECNTPLHAAAKKPAEKIIAFLLDHQSKMLSAEQLKSYVNRKNVFGQTALHCYLVSRQGQYSIGEPDLDMVKKLVAAGADITIEDAQGRTPWHIACNGGLGKIKEYLEAVKNGMPYPAPPAPPPAPAPKPVEEKPVVVVAEEKESEPELPAVPAWTRKSEFEIVRLSALPEANAGLTEIFNFKAQTYVYILQGANNALGVTLKAFRELEGTPLLAEAKEAFLGCGGKFEQQSQPVRHVTLVDSPRG